VARALATAVLTAALALVAQPAAASGGRLRDGVQLPAEGLGYVTWAPVLQRTPNRGSRRWGTLLTVARVDLVLGAYHDAHPDAPRVLVGDLSRPHGGPFGARYGGLGHLSHRTGLDVDVYYPRRDLRVRAPLRPAQVDRALAQELVDRFVGAGAIRIFVGPHLHLHGPRGVVSPLVHHDDHLHVRFAPD